MVQEMEYKDVEPRVAVTVEGKIIFFDKKGETIPKLKEMKPKELEELMSNNEPLSTHKITVYTFGPGSPCKLIWCYDGGCICFSVDCVTNEILGLC